MIGPVAAQITLGAAIGFCVGFLARKVGKLVAILVELAFVLVQLLAYAEVLTIDWAPIATWWDGVRRPENLERQWSVLFGNLPALAGAVPGFLLGLKKG